jgi:pimeloyl-ACP methyl ester carboxylesterase
MILWAHGLEGSPNGAKVSALRAAGLEIVSPDGRGLALSGRLDALLAESETLAPRRPVLAGSSYGGLAAAWLCAQHPERFRGVLLLAPALHYHEPPIDPAAPLVAPNGLPVRIIHGRGDAVVPVQASRDYVARSGGRVALEEVDDGHSLVASLPRIEAALRALLAG